MVGSSQGSAILEKQGVPTHLSIPDHREVRVGTLLREIRRAGLTVGEFIQLLGR
jgi:hypothetical protein